MLDLAALVLVMSCGSVAPAPAEPVEVRPDPRDTELVVRVLDLEARAARRKRMWRSSLLLAFGSMRGGLGTYGLVSPRFNPVMRRTAAALTVLGAFDISRGIYGLVRPSAIERVRGGPEYAALVADGSDTVAWHRLRQRWAEEASTRRTWRHVIGSGYIVSGLGLVVTGTLFLAPRDQERTRTETLWSLTTLGTGVSLVLTGSLRIAIPSHVERTHRTYVGTFERPGSGWAQQRRRGRARVSPTVGGVVVSGTF